MPNSVYTSLNSPDNVRLYEGAFVHDVERQEEIVAVHLAATTSDIVLLFGFNLTELKPNLDRLLSHKAHHHRNLVQQAFITYNHVQWVVVDHPEAIMKELIGLPNLSTDTMENVLTFFND
jgi:hypothetical protein